MKITCPNCKQSTMRHNDWRFELTGGGTRRAYADTLRGHLRCGFMLGDHHRAGIKIATTNGKDEVGAFIIGKLEVAIIFCSALSREGKRDKMIGLFSSLIFGVLTDITVGRHVAVRVGVYQNGPISVGIQPAINNVRLRLKNTRSRKWFKKSFLKPEFFNFLKKKFFFIFAAKKERACKSNEGDQNTSTDF